MKNINEITVPVRIDIDEGIEKLEKAKKLLEEIKISTQEVKELFKKIF